MMCDHPALVELDNSPQAKARRQANNRRERIESLSYKIISLIDTVQHILEVT